MDEELIEQTTEENIEIETEEIVESAVNVEDLDHSAEVEEEVISVDVAPVEEIEIDVEEAVGWTGGNSTQHSSLFGRDEPNQHPISAIVGLRDELNEIEALKTVYSDKNGVANYYEWYDGEHTEYGYFVSLVPHTSKITICDGTDIFGVTVDSAGFVGLQDKDFPRNNNYGLVATSGLVDVQCESDVVEGDYVVSNAYGIATKTDSGCGYKVIATEDKHGVFYATISLGVQACVTDTLGKELQHLDGRMGDAEINIAAAMNTANEAYNKAEESISSNASMSNQIADALVKVDNMATDIDNMGSQVSDIAAISAQVKAIVTDAVISAESARNEAVTKANEALDKAVEIEKTVEPISSWEYTDPVTGETNKGATYFAEYVKNGLSTKAEMETVNKLDEENKLLIEKNAENYTQMLSSIDKYSIGEYSQAYGLTAEQAKSILKAGMVYIPTTNHTEPLFAGGEKEMLRKAFYVWGGEFWGNETLNSVWLGSDDPGNSYKYWYTELDTAADGYEPHTLYVLEDNTWKQVATLAGNINNRLTSMIRQDVNSVTAEVVNARGSTASLGARLDENGARVSMVASVVTELSDTTPIGIYETIDMLPETAESGVYYCVGTSAPYDVYKWNGIEFEKELLIYYDGAHFCKINTASIVSAVNNNGDSSISLNADKINFSGLSTFFSTDENGSITSINGGGIKTGAIQSINYEKDVSGSKISLEDGTIDSNHFKVSSTGEITATSGHIGGWIIDVQKLYSYSVVDGKTYGAGMSVDAGVAANPAFWAGCNYATPWEATSATGSWTDQTKFYVTHEGKFVSKNAQIEGEITATSGSIGGWKIENGYLGTLASSANSLFISPGKSAWSGLAGGTKTFMIYAKDKFAVDTSGTLYATGAKISGTITAESGNFSGDVTIGERPISSWITSDGFVYDIAAKSGSVGPFKISGNTGVYIGNRNQFQNNTVTNKSGVFITSDSYDGTTVNGVGGISIGSGASDTSWFDQFLYAGRHVITGCGGRNFYAKTALKYNGLTFHFSSSSALSADDAKNPTGSKKGAIEVRSDGVYLTGTWFGTSEYAITSDKNLKNSIELMPEKYSILFDELHPVIYRYNDGTSNRYHTGFIAQDVKHALDVAEIDTSDFAGYIDTENGLALRYSEFISLNTWQIQKLKARVSELEDQIALLIEDKTD